MSSMVSTVLEIEREAEALLGKAGEEAERLVADAKKQRAAAAEAASQKVREELRAIEAKALADREKKVQDLTISGERDLAAVRNITDDAFDKGVGHVMKTLAGE